MARLFEPSNISGFDNEDPVSQFEDQAIFSPVEATPTTSQASEVQKGLIRGGANLKTGLADFGSLVADAAGAEGVSDYLSNISEKTTQDTQRFKARIGSLAEAETAEDYFDFITGGVAESVPFLASTIATGGVAGLTAKTIGAGATGVRAAQVGGAFASTAAPETGFTHREIQEETGTKQPGLALAAGAAKGALDVFALGKNLRTFLPKKFRTDGGRSVLKDIASTATVEGVTEATQELIDIGAIRSAKDAELFSSLSTEEFQRMLDSAALGAAGGAAFGGAGRAAVAISEKIQKEFSPESTFAGLPIGERITQILNAVPEGQRERFAKSQNFDNFEDLSVWMHENAEEQILPEKATDVDEFRNLDDVAQAAVEEIFHKGSDSVPWPNIDLWKATDPSGKKVFTDDIEEAFKQLHRERGESVKVFNAALAQGLSNEEAQSLMELESPYEISNALDLAKKRAERFGISENEAINEIAESIFAKWPKMRAVASRVGLRNLLANSRYIENRTTDAAPFSDLEITTQELSERGEHTIFRKAGWDALNRVPKVAKNQIPVTIKKRVVKDKKASIVETTVGLDFQSLINSAFRKGQGIRNKATHSLERVADAMFAGISSLYSEESVDGAALTETLKNLTQEQKEKLIVYTTAEGTAFSYADLENASKTTKTKQTYLEKKQAELASLRRTSKEVTEISKTITQGNLTNEEFIEASGRMHALMEGEISIDSRIDFLEEEVAELRLEAATRDFGTKIAPEVEEVKDPEAIEDVPLRPLFGGKTQFQSDITEERFEKRETQSEKAAANEAARKEALEDYKSSGFVPQEDVSYAENEVGDTNWAAHEGFQSILRQAEEMAGSVGLENRVSILTPLAMDVIAFMNNSTAEFQEGALYGQAFTGENLKKRVDLISELSGMSKEEGRALFEKDTGVDLDSSEYFVYVNPKLTREKATEVLSHEIGHLVLFEGIKNGTITPEIMAEYNNWLDYIRETDPLVREIFKDRSDFAMSSLYSSMLNQRVSDFIANDEAAETINYLLDFHEWFADRVRNRLLDPKPPIGTFEKALEKIVNRLRKLFKLGVVIEDTVEDYVEALMKGSRTNAWNTTNAPHEVLRNWRDNIQVTRNAAMSQKERARASKSDFELIRQFIKRTTGHRLSPADLEFVQNLAMMHRHDALGAAFNRSFRYGFKVLLNENEKEIVSNAMNTAFVKRQVAELLRDSPEAWEDAKSNPDAMAAYAYQFWITGQVKLGKKSTGIFQKLFDIFKDLLGIVLESENAEMLLNEFTTGNAYLRSQNVAGAQFHVKAAARDTVIQRAVHDHLAPAWKKLSNSRVGTALFSTANNRMFQTRNQWLIKIASMVSARIGTQFESEDMLTQRTQKIAQFHNEVYRVFNGKSEEFGQEVVGILNSGQKFTPQERKTNSNAFKSLSEAEQAAVRTKIILNRMHAYMKDAGMDIGFHENYFPWVFDEQYLGQNLNEFVDLLSAPEFAEDMAKADLTPDGVAQSIMQSRGYADLGISRDETGHTPSFTAMHERVLSFIETKGTPEQRALLGTFFSKDIGHTLTTYIEQSVKRTEYSRRFGDGKLEKMLDNAAQHGATQEQIDLAKTYMDAIMGTHGFETNKKLAELMGLEAPAPGEIINHKLQRVMGVAMVYQNVRVLALSTLTSLVDPVGIAVRTGDMGIAFQSLRLGIKAAFKNAQGDDKILADMAEMLGITDRQMTVEALNWEYGGVYITGMERRINEGFFRMIGLQAWTRATRIMGLEGGLRFIGRHATNPNQHSERFLAELNLRPEDVITDEKGRTKILTAEERRSAMSEEIARDDRVRAALHRFIDGAILRPNAALRPIWASDPHFMLIFHLKSFMYSFHEQILKRVVLEAANGHLTPMLMFGLFIPFMMAGDELRDLIKFGGDGDPQKEQWDVLDYIGNSMERSGMLGLGQIVADAGQDIKYGGLGYESFSGPTVQQMEDIFLDENYDWVNASPLQNVVKHYWETE